MIVTGIGTHKILPGENIYGLLDCYLPSTVDNTVLAITSKVVSICENNIIKIGSIDKGKLIIEESDRYLPFDNGKYGVNLTVKHNILIPNAGIDESNGSGYYILWPQNPQKSANKIRSYIMKKYDIENIGVIITDSTTTPLRWGTTGIAIAYSGFRPLNNYIGKKDIFKREMAATKADVCGALAAAAVLVMGEGSEQTPMALINDVNNIVFCKNNPSKKEVAGLRIDMGDDIYGELLKNAEWRRKG